jgi:hypothetical protein
MDSPSGQGIGMAGKAFFWEAMPGGEGFRHGQREGWVWFPPWRHLGVARPMGRSSAAAGLKASFPCPATGDPQECAARSLRGTGRAASGDDARQRMGQGRDALRTARGTCRQPWTRRVVWEKAGALAGWTGQGDCTNDRPTWPSGIAHPTAQTISDPVPASPQQVPHGKPCAGSPCPSCPASSPATEGVLLGRASAFHPARLPSGLVPSLRSGSAPWLPLPGQGGEPFHHAAAPWSRTVPTVPEPPMQPPCHRRQPHGRRPSPFPMSVHARTMRPTMGTWTRGPLLASGRGASANRAPLRHPYGRSRRPVAGLVARSCLTAIRLCDFATLATAFGTPCLRGSAFWFPGESRRCPGRPFVHRSRSHRVPALRPWGCDWICRRPQKSRKSQVPGWGGCRPGFPAGQAVSHHMSCPAMGP